MITQNMIINNIIVCDYIDIIEDDNTHRKFCGDSLYLLYMDENKLLIKDNSENIYYWSLMNIRSFTCHPVKED